MDQGNGAGVRITLEEDGGGKNRVVFAMADGSQLKLTLGQARLLATELIVVVNRAEVRRSLTRSPNLSRRPEAVVHDSRLIQTEFAKQIDP